MYFNIGSNNFHLSVESNLRLHKSSHFFFHSVIGHEDSRHPLNQSDTKLEPIVTRSHLFSRATGSLRDFTLSEFSLFLFCLAVVLTLVLVLQYAMANC